MALLLFSAVIGVAYSQTGSLSKSIEWLRGERFLQSAGRIDLGTVGKGQEVEFVVEFLNLTSQPVTLVGAQRSCDCVSLSEFPLAIPAGESVRLPGAIAVPIESGEFSQTIKFFTNYQGRPQILFEVSGRVP